MNDKFIESFERVLPSYKQGKVDFDKTTIGAIESVQLGDPRFLKELMRWAHKYSPVQLFIMGMLFHSLIQNDQATEAPLNEAEILAEVDKIIGGM